MGQGDLAHALDRQVDDRRLHPVVALAVDAEIAFYEIGRLFAEAAHVVSRAFDSLCRASLADQQIGQRRVAFRANGDPSRIARQDVGHAERRVVLRLRGLRFAHLQRRQLDQCFLRHVELHGKPVAFKHRPAFAIALEREAVVSGLDIDAAGVVQAVDQARIQRGVLDFRRRRLALRHMKSAVGNDGGGDEEQRFPGSHGVPLSDPAAMAHGADDDCNDGEQQRDEPDVQQLQAIAELLDVLAQVVLDRAQFLAGLQLFSAE